MNVAALPALTVAQRMRAHRQRRRDGMRCLMIEVRQEEILALTRQGLLPNDRQNDTDSIKNALYAFLDRALWT